MESILTPEEHAHIESLWNAANSKEQNDWGIPNYKAPPLNIDLVKKKKEREQQEFYEQVWKAKQRYPKPKEKYDSKGDLIIPQRGNYFEEQIKKKDFGHSQDKEEKLKQKHSNHNRSFMDQVEIIDKVDVINDKDKSILYRYNKETIFDDIIKIEKKNEKINPQKESLIKKLKDEIEKEKSENIKTISEILRKKYENKGSLPKDIKISVFDDNQYLGERVPFYYTPSVKTTKNAKGPKNVKNRSQKNNKTDDHLFFPKIEPTVPHSPSFGYYKPLPLNKEVKERRNEIFKNKISSIKQKWEDHKVKFIDDIAISYRNLHPINGVFAYKKPLKKSEKYKDVRKNKPSLSPGPQQYFKGPKYERSKSAKKKMFPIDDLEKKWSKPMNKILF